MQVDVPRFPQSSMIEYCSSHGSRVTMYMTVLLQVQEGRKNIRLNAFMTPAYTNLVPRGSKTTKYDKAFSESNE